MRTGLLNPDIAGSVDGGRLVVHLASDLSADDVLGDEGRLGVGVRRGHAAGWVGDEDVDDVLAGNVRDGVVGHDQRNPMDGQGHYTGKR